MGWPHTDTHAVWRAGLPMTSACGGTLFVTTEPIPTMENAPRVTPGPTVAFAPMVVPLQTRVAKVSSVTSDVSRPVRALLPERGNLSLVKTTCAESMQKSSIVTCAQTYTEALILT